MHLRVESAQRSALNSQCAQNEVHMTFRSVTSVTEALSIWSEGAVLMKDFRDLKVSERAHL
jgi:hypothetical protein